MKKSFNFVIENVVFNVKYKSKTADEYPLIEISIGNKEIYYIVFCRTEVWSISTCDYSEHKYKLFDKERLKLDILDIIFQNFSLIQRYYAENI